MVDLVLQFFDRIDMMIFIFEDRLQDLSCGEVFRLARHEDGFVIGFDGDLFRLMIGVQLLRRIGSDFHRSKFRHDGNPFQKQNPDNQLLSMLHFVDRTFLKLDIIYIGKVGGQMTDFYYIIIDQFDMVLPKF